MPVEIHPSADVAKGAQLEDGVKVLAFASVGPDVQLGAGTVVQQGAVVMGHTTLGRDCVIHPCAVIGGPPQDLSYRGEPTRLEVGDRNVIREGVTMNTGTIKGGGLTRVGHDNLFMACSHVAHDCQVGSHVVMANAVLLAGHVVVGDYVVFGGAAGVHHFVSIGRMAMVGGMAKVLRDVPPFTMFEGIPGSVLGLNLVGLKRRGIDGERLHALREAYKAIWRGEENLTAAVERLAARTGNTPEVAELLASLRASARGKQGRALEAHRVVDTARREGS